MSLARIVHDLFFSDHSHYSEGYVKSNGDKGFKAIAGIPLLSQIEEHFIGEVTLGAYTVIPGSNTVRWAAFDVDASNLQVAREIVRKLSEFLMVYGIRHAIEFSGRKGYHIILFFENPESAQEVKETCEKIRDVLGLQKNGDPHVEVFPKQGKLEKNEEGEYELGSLLRLPLGAHPSTKVITFFVDTNTWEAGEPLDPEKIFSEKTTLELLKSAVAEINPFERIVAILAPYWKAHQRHDISLYISGTLAMQGWTEETVTDLITAIHELAPEGELSDQIKTVESTFKKYANGGKIIGITGLGTILPTSVLNEVLELAGAKSSPVILQTIDLIRLEKGAGFMKVRKAAQAALLYYKEQGRLVRNLDVLYWLDRNDHCLTTFDTPDWDRLLHNQLGLNLLDSFGRQTGESIKHFSYVEAEEVTVHKRSYWHESGGKEYINLGGPEIYILSGDKDKRELVFNGEIDILFENANDTLKLPNLNVVDVEPISPWPFLVDDVNFKQDASATPLQQREIFKAWICSLFFGEIMPTRAILALLAAAGAGKTTTARRVLWLLEGYLQDVLGQVPDKPDALRASMAAHKICVLDNLEKSKAAWLPDVLNRAATGSQVEVRELYTSNRMKKIPVDVFMILTATEMPFSEETVYTRLLPIELAPLTVSRPEHQIRADLINNFNAFWKGMLDDLDKVVAELNKVKTVSIPSQSRLADFYVFCQRIKGVDFIDGDELIKGMDNLVNRQKELLKESSPFVDVLIILLNTQPEEMSKWHGISELYARGQRSAALNKQEWRWASAAGLAKHVQMLESQLIQNFGMSVKDTPTGGKIVRQYKFDNSKTILH